MLLCIVLTLFFFSDFFIIVGLFVCSLFLYGDTLGCVGGCLHVCIVYRVICAVDFDCSHHICRNDNMYADDDTEITQERKKQEDAKLGKVSLFNFFKVADSGPQDAKVGEIPLGRSSRGCFLVARVLCVASRILCVVSCLVFCSVPEERTLEQAGATPYVARVWLRVSFSVFRCASWIVPRIVSCHNDLTNVYCISNRCCRVALRIDKCGVMFTPPSRSSSHPPFLPPLSWSLPTPPFPPPPIPVAAFPLPLPPPFPVSFHPPRFHPLFLC